MEKKGEIVLHDPDSVTAGLRVTKPSRHRRRASQHHIICILKKKKKKLSKNLVNINVFGSVSDCIQSLCVSKTHSHQQCD